MFLRVSLVALSLSLSVSVGAFADDVRNVSECIPKYEQKRGLLG